VAHAAASSPAPLTEVERVDKISGLIRIAHPIFDFNEQLALGNQRFVDIDSHNIDPSFTAP
jgi:hypothetical protein